MLSQHVLPLIRGAAEGGGGAGAEERQLQGGDADGGDEMAALNDFALIDSKMSAAYESDVDGPVSKQ